MVTVKALFLLFAIASAQYYSIDGVGNNEEEPQLQAQNQPFIRLLPNRNTYADGIEAIDESLPNVRELSNRLFSMENAAPNNNLADLRNVLHIAFGQFISHDMQRVETTNPNLDVETQSEAVQIPVPIGDPWFDPEFTGTKFFNFTRSKLALNSGRGTNTPKNIINHVSPLLDLNVIYGESNEVNSKIRNSTHPAYLLTGRTKTGELTLPFNTLGVTMDDPFRRVPETLYAAGNQLANQNTLLLVPHILFLLNHNRLVDQLSEEHESWGQERLYLEARKRNIAQYQAIVLNEYVPSVTGEPLPVYDGYKNNLSTQTDLQFVAAFRFAHSNSPEELVFASESREILTTIRFRDTYFTTQLVDNLGVSNLVRGTMLQPQLSSDVAYVSDLRNFLFGRPGSGGLDMAALDIWRARDHGNELYNDAREYYGLPRVETFDEVVSDYVVAQTLEYFYGHPDNAESYVVGLAEDATPGLVGPLFSAIIREQFIRTRDGDRYYFENADAEFSDEEKEEIARTTIADIILATTNVAQLPCSAFFVSELGCGTEPPRDESLLFDTSVELLGGDIILSWSIEGDIIHFSVEADTRGWVAIGLASNPGNMVGADAMIGAASGSIGAVSDYKITARSVGCAGVCPDTEQGGNNDVFDSDGSEIGGRTYLQWSRALDTGDGDDEAIKDDGNPTPIVFAMSASNSDTLGYHQGNKGAAEINFFTGDFALTGVDVGNQGANDRLTVHGVLMFVAWAAIFPLGMVAVKFCRKILPGWWFRLHMFLQYFGVIVIIVALIFAVEAVADFGDRKHINNAHAIMGIITVSLAIIVPALGQATAVTYEAPKKIPWFPDRIHLVFGYFAPFVAYATIFLGLYEKDADWWWYLLVSLWIFVITVTYWTAYILQYLHTMYESKKNRKANAAVAEEEEAEDSWSSDE